MSISPRVRLAIGAGGLAVSALLVHRDRVEPGEAQLFEAVNDLPDRLYGPVWVVMQCGNVLAAPAAAAVAAASGRRRLALRLVVSGTATWAAAKIVKWAVRRPRPERLLASVSRRGAEQAGLGFASGHAGVAVALLAAAYPELTPRARRRAIEIAGLVAGSRLYIGAHLPLDVVGGAALGLATEAAVELASR